jgi:hypothetical protein
MEAERSSETVGITPHGLTPYDSTLLTLLFVLCDVYLQLSLSLSLSLFQELTSSPVW